MTAQQHVAIIGGGICGMTAAIRLAESSFKVTLFEAAAKVGGRTRSFYDAKTETLCDNGPHLMLGAYHATRKLLHDIKADHLHWQKHLSLPLWDQQRQHFTLEPSTALPFPIALLLAIRNMPGHGYQSILAMLRLAVAMRRCQPDQYSVKTVLQQCRIPRALIQDMIEPICLGAMNEPLESANARTLLRVLKESFASADAARLGWFTAPLDQALMAPLLKHARALGVQVHTSRKINTLKIEQGVPLLDGERFDAAILAMPCHATARLLQQPRQCETGAITNIHLWYRNHKGLPQALVGGVGTVGHWFFDISAQMHQKGKSLRHICVVISAAEKIKDKDALIQQVSHEFAMISKQQERPFHSRIIQEKRATVLVRNYQPFTMPSNSVVDASESPCPGMLPATIEAAVQRGEYAAKSIEKQLTS